MSAISLIRVVLVLEEPGGVAGPEQELHPSIDLPLATTPDGTQPYVPATSVAGSLRHHLTTDPDLADHVEALMGPPPDRQEEELTPSSLRILGTQIDTHSTVSQARIAINRARQAAAAGSGLRKSQHLAPGTRITVFAQLDRTELWELLRRGLEDWQAFIGGGRTTGHGAAVVEEVHHGVLDLATRKGRRRWLTTRGPELFNPDNLNAVELSTTRTAPFFSAQWTIVDGLHIGIGGDSSREPRSAEPILTDHNDQPCIPGSTWKGLLRSRCEFILRSLGVPACRPQAADDIAAHQSSPPCEECLICHAFGTAGTNEHGGRRGSLAFANSTIDNAVLDEQQHVALDRVTGGAHPGLLYTEEVVRSGSFTLTVRALEQTPSEVYALLVLACRDIHDGYVGIGGKSRRGHGTACLTRPEDELDRHRDEAIKILNDYCANYTHGEA